MSFKNIQRVRTESQPLYSNVASLIRNKIIIGDLEPGVKLPGEEELANQLGVSLITIRTALSRLSDEGLVVRNRPKGTFVANDIPARQQYVFTGHLYDIVRNAMGYDVTLLGIDKLLVKETRNAKIVRSFFNLTNDNEISLLRRVRTLEGTPICFLENFILTSIAKHLDPEELSKKTLLKHLKEALGLSIGRGEMYVEGVSADADIAEALQIQLFDPTIFMQAYLWFPSGEPFEIVNLFMRSEYFKYKIELDAKRFEEL